jgi:O-antigen ligase
MVRSSQLWVTIGALTLAPLFFGSVDQVWVAVWTVVLGISTVLGVAVPLNKAQLRILAAFLAVCLVYATVAVVQVIPHFLVQFDDPIWHRSNELLGTAIPPRISGTSEIPPVAVGHFLLLVTSFLSGFFAGTSRRNATALMLAASLAILLYAIYGLIALDVSPDLLLWAPKLAYRNSLTATFVNHNTAAAFFGCGAILWATWTCLTAQTLQASSLRLLLLNSINEQLAFRIALRASAMLTCLFALLLTDSRGGLICSSLALLVSMSLMVAGKFKTRFGYAILIFLVGLIGVVAWLTRMGRIGSEGVMDDGRWQVYGFSIEAIYQRPLFGSGAGTFESLLPSLRTINFNNWGVWDYAHSTILEIAIEMGVPVATIVAVAACASVFIMFRRGLKSDDSDRAALAAITGIAVLSYLHSMIDFSLQIPGYLITFGILLGCGVAKAGGDEAPRSRRRSRGAVELAPQISDKKILLEAGSGKAG